MQELTWGGGVVSELVVVPYVRLDRHLLLLLNAHALARRPRSGADEFKVITTRKVKVLVSM